MRDWMIGLKGDFYLSIIIIRELLAIGLQLLIDIVKLMAVAGK